MADLNDGHAILHRMVVIQLARSGKALKLIVILGCGAIAVCCLCCGGLGMMWKEAAKDSSTHSSNFENRNADAGAAISPKVERAAENDGSEGKAIRGLLAKDAYGVFVRQGFSLYEEVIPAGFDSGIAFPELYIWRWTKTSSAHEKMVEVFGESRSHITLVRATFSNYTRGNTDESGRAFMADVAGLRFDGTQTKKAQAWAKNNIGKNTTTTIAGIKYELNANAPSVRVLLIQPAQGRANTVSKANAKPKSSDPRENGAATEREAANKLRLAKRLLNKSIPNGERWLREIIKEYPKTKGAQEAQSLLDGFEK